MVNAAPRVTGRNHKIKLDGGRIKANKPLVSYGNL